MTSGDCEDEHEEGQRDGRGIARLLLLEPVRTAMSTSVEVESSGPPWVMMLTWVNRENAAIVMVIRMKVRV